jgi:hypothetical protein
MTATLRLAVIADPHVSVDRLEDAAWHNPFRLADAHERFATALAHEFVADADVVVCLGDLVHFGDPRSLRVVADLAAGCAKPVLLLSGNHDVIDPPARIEHAVDAVASPRVLCPLGGARADVTDAFGRAFRVEVHEVRALARAGAQPFDVSQHVLVDAPDPAPRLLLTHFPVLSLEARCRDEQLLYSGHLDQLAPVETELAGERPVIVLSGHLHLRGYVHAANVLQLCMAALVEAPYEIARVELHEEREHVRVVYECVSVAPVDASRLPVLCPSVGAFTFDAGAWAARPPPRMAKTR